MSYCSQQCRHHQPGLPISLTVAWWDIDITAKMKILRATTDNSFIFNIHINDIVKAFIYMLHVTLVRRFRKTKVEKTLTSSIICSQSDYCNSLSQQEPNKTVATSEQHCNNTVSCRMSYRNSFTRSAIASDPKSYWMLIFYRAHRLIEQRYPQASLSHHFSHCNLQIRDCMTLNQPIDCISLH